jgi:hypothetical protein
VPPSVSHNASRHSFGGTARIVWVGDATGASSASLLTWPGGGARIRSRRGKRRVRGVLPFATWHGMARHGSAGATAAPAEARPLNRRPCHAAVQIHTCARCPVIGRNKSRPAERPADHRVARHRRSAWPRR